MSTDDLLDEATRLADSDWPPAALTIPVLRALVERVQQAEAERETCYSDECGEPCQSWQAMKRAEMAEYKRQAETTGQRLGEARGKLDKVRDWAHHIRTTRQRGDIEYNAASDVLAILDGRE